jgi:hypothetical protein
MAREPDPQDRLTRWRVDGDVTAVPLDDDPSGYVQAEPGVPNALRRENGSVPVGR